MAKVQAKNAVEEQDDGLREKMIAVNRATVPLKSESPSATPYSVTEVPRMGMEVVAL